MLLLDSNFSRTPSVWTRNFPKWTWLKIHELFSNTVTILAKSFPALWALLQFRVTLVADDVAIGTLVDW